MANEVNENVTTNEEVTYDVVPVTEQKNGPSKGDYVAGIAGGGLALYGLWTLITKVKDKINERRAKKRGKTEFQEEAEELEEILQEDDSEDK